MKKIVRKGCFEVNSSSTHSISIADSDKEFVLDVIYPDQDGIIYVHGGEFGWEWEKYNDAATKLSYVYQYGIDQKLIEEVLKDQTGATEIVFVDNSQGYVDHQSIGDNDISNKEELRNFIFNKNSWLFTGNDNSEADPTFYHVPEYKDGKMIVPKYKYELVIDNFPKTTKFLSYPSLEDINNGIESLLDNNYPLTENGDFIVNDDIYFQIYRDKNKYYIKDWVLIQDYSTNTILFLKENDKRMDDIKDEYRNLPWDERSEKIMEKAMETPGLIKKVNFKIIEI